MTRLPTPGSDAGNWGDILNDFLSQALKPDGTLKDSSVGSTQIIANAVTNVQLADNSVTSLQLSNSSVQTLALEDSSVTTTKLVNESVTRTKFAAGVLASATIADGSVTTLKFADTAVTNAKVGAAIQTSLSAADTASQTGHAHAIADVTDLQTTLDGKQVSGLYVPTTRNVAGHNLTGDVVITPTDIGAATAVQGAKAVSAVQPGSLATVATTGAYDDLTGQPTLGSASGLDVGITAGTIAAGDDARIIAAVPSTRNVAGHPLSANVIIVAADLSAASVTQGALAATAVQPKQVVASMKRIVGMTYFAVSSRAFPALVRPPEPGRSRLIIRNMGTNNVNVVVAGRTVANYNSPGWTGSISVAAGKELVAHNCTSDLFIGPDADGTLIKVKVYAEVNA